MSADLDVVDRKQASNGRAQNIVLNRVRAAPAVNGQDGGGKARRVRGVQAILRLSRRSAHLRGEREREISFAVARVRWPVPHINYKLAVTASRRRARGRTSVLGPLSGAGVFAGAENFDLREDFDSQHPNGTRFLLVSRYGL